MDLQVWGDCPLIWPKRRRRWPGRGLFCGGRGGLFGDKLEEAGEGGFGHAAVVESGEFAQLGIRVTGDFHHAPEVSIFLIAAVEFQLAIAGDEEQGRSLFSHMVERGEFVEERLGRADAAF